MDKGVFNAFGHKLRVRVCGLLIEEDTLLLVRHRFPGERMYLWAPPGGGIEFGESAHAALKREFLEETGIKVEVKQLCFVYDFFEHPLHALELFFEVQAVDRIQSKLGIDPELSSDQQILDKLAFLDMRALNALPASHLHGCLRGIQHVSDLIKWRGYFSEHHSIIQDNG